MKHNLKTIWNKIIEVNYKNPELKNSLLEEVSATQKELQQLKRQRLRHIMIDEILGENHDE